MILGNAATPARCTAVWLALGAPALAIAAAVAPALDGTVTALAGDGWTRWSFEELLVRLLAAAALLAVAWLWLVAGAVALAAARGDRAEGVRGCPATWRRLVLVACGSALATGLLATPSVAQSPPLPTPVGVPTDAAPTSDSPDLHGLPLPDRSPGPAPRTGARPAPSAVVVAPGDCLWDLAAAELDRGPGGPADLTAIDGRWREWYAANARVVGDDPGLLLPGQRLRPPPLPDTP